MKEMLNYNQAFLQIFTKSYADYSNDLGEEQDEFHIDKTMGTDVRFHLDVVHDKENNVLDSTDKLILSGELDKEYMVEPEGLDFYEFQEDDLPVSIRSS